VVITGGARALRLRSGDVLCNNLLGPAAHRPAASCTPDRVTNALFSSGTTGDPKVIPWTHLTPIKCAMDGHFHQDIRPGDVVAWPTSIGWMMGPWLVYASLINGAAIALYEGLPTSEGFVRFVADAGVTMLGVVPSLVRTWRDSARCGDVEWPTVRVFSSTGEPSGAEDYLWLMSRARFGAPVVEYCGGTEIGGGYITGTVVQPASPSTFTTAALGLDLELLDEHGRPVSDGEMGEVFLVPPSIGLSQQLAHRDHHEVYYAGCPTGPDGRPLRRHGDQMVRLPGGFFQALGRADDTMNLGGIKTSSRELEAVVNDHPAVFECAAIGARIDGHRAEHLVLYVVPAADIEPRRLHTELRSLIARRLNPLFKVHDVVVTESLPRTASNKLMRRTLRDDYDRRCQTERS
jgi:acetyl-CoA synthetase